MTDTYETVAVSRDGSYGTVIIDRPEAMNSVHPQVLRELADAFDSLRDDDGVNAIVLTGAGDRAFIGGGDIKKFSERDGIWFISEFREAMSDLEHAIERNPKPVVAAVDGVALGGGTEIAMMCDVVLASEGATFGQPEIGLGIIPGSGGTQRLAHLVGYLKAKELVLTGRHVVAEEAVDIGLANEVVPEDEFDDRVDELVTELADGPAIAQWFGKRAVNRTRGDLQTGLDLEAALAALAFETEDKTEGMEAFVEKRDASFTETI